MKTRVANELLADVMDRHAVLGAPELWHAEGDRLRCVACGHRCLIGEGLRGICKVRYNEGGQLKVPFGYVAGVQCDPVEKKPFFHVYPSNDALTFGMLGCDLHCSYCFPGSTTVITDRGPITLEDAFQSSPQKQPTHDAEIAYPDGLRAVAASGNLRAVRAVFRHAYKGQLTVLLPYYLPELRCTPDHRIYATTDPAVPPQPVKASELTGQHFLAIPRLHSFSSAQTIDVEQELDAHRTSYRVPWKLSVEEREWIIQASERGETSRQIGEALGKSASYIRHVRSKIAKGRANDVRSGGLLVQGHEVRFPNERRPGIPRTIPLDASFARLLGLYCAEGCITKGKNRPNSYTLNFSFSHQESGLVEEVCQLIDQCLRLRATRVRRDTTLAVAVSKSSAALLFKCLAGTGAAAKRVPLHLFNAPREIVKVFLDSYLEGDGHRYPNGKVSTTTVSRELAYGIAFLVLKLGFLPSIYDAPMPGNGTIQGRIVNRSPHQFAVVWYETPPPTRKMVETEHHYLIPLREVSAVEYEGDIYNMEVEEEHNYLAGLFLVSNCQNWITSQALRDANAVVPLRPVTPQQLTDLARRNNARLVVSSYNEPLITAEWAVSVFREATAAGLACAFVSNGNATPEVLDYLRPWIVAYKVDLKGFTERGYRSLGGTLENITRTIRMLHERGLWLEVVTLIVPGFNDSDDELRQAARFLASVSPDIPWHVTAFHQDYKMTEPEPTGAARLMRAAEIGTAEGLRFVYAGNLPGQVGPWENTRCPSCRATLIERFGYLVRSYRVTPDGRCPSCQTQIPGVWPGTAAEVRMGDDMAAYRSRLPRPVHVTEMGGQGDKETRRQGDKERNLVPLASVSSGGPVSSSPNLIVTLSSAEGTPPMSSARQAVRRPDLNAEQRQQIIACAAALLRTTVTGQPAGRNDLDQVRDHPLEGAFISLKRGKHLRSCCGMLGQTLPLLRALEHATVRVAREDERFPPISATELDHLDLEVWLLYNLQPVPVRGEERAAAITIGKHGVKVVRGDASGLFLPSVAVESNWDGQRCLDQVCVKAGLPPTAWREDDTILYTFEGQSLRGKLAELVNAEGGATRGTGRSTRSEDVQAYAGFCRDNLGHILAGRVPTYFLPWTADGNVSGVVLGVRREGVTESLRFSQYSLRHGLPLQSTLFNLTQAAAQQLASEGMRGGALAGVQIELGILLDPVLHGTVADPHLADLDPRRRAVLLFERNKNALLYDPARSAEELVTAAASQMRVTDPDSAAVFSVDFITNVNALDISTTPRPVRGPAIRPTAVAGQFYDADPGKLSQLLDRLLVGECRDEPWRAALVPHAGLRFSGQIAADVLKRIRIPRTVIVIGPKHTVQGMDWAVAPHQTWALPGGGIESDFLLARKLCQAIPGLELDAAAHQVEHAIEVELPLLARLAPQARVVGIAIGHARLDDCRRIASGLADLMRESEERPLLLISSDMNHFANDAETRRLDALALAALDRCDPVELYETVNRHTISMCGVLPAVIVLETLRLLGGPQKAERVGYATTADVTRDPSRVVGYAGMLFS